MGIVIKQSIKGSIWSYLGVAIGFVTTTYLYTEYLTPEVVGLFGLLISISALSSNLSALGMDAVTSRIFPVFRDDKNAHNGFFITAILPQIVGFLLFLVVFYVFKDNIIANNIEKSPLLARYVYLIVPLVFATRAFSFLDVYNKMLYNTVLSVFLNEFVQRILIFLVVSLYAFEFITLDQLIVGYAVAVSVKAMLILFYLLKERKISLRPNWKFLTKELRKEMADVAFFSVVAGMGTVIIFQIDKIIINQLLDLHNVGVYTIAFFFGTLVTIPSRTLIKISGTLIADAWKVNDVDTIKSIYYKSCINQFVIGGLLFLGIWVNIDNILIILGDAYAQSKWVIFFIGLGYLFDMTTGVNGQVISFSKHYRIQLLFVTILIGIVVGLLYLLIPLWGIVGAAVAIALALLLNNLMRYLFLFRKYKMQPFNYKFIIVAGFYSCLWFLLTLIPQQKLVIDLLIRGAVIVFTSGVFLIVFPISEEIKSIILKAGQFFRRH